MRPKDLKVGDLLIEAVTPNVTLFGILVKQERIWDRPPYSVCMHWFDLKTHMVEYMWSEEEKLLPQRWCIVREGNVLYRGSHVSENFEYVF